MMIYSEILLFDLEMVNVKIPKFDKFSAISNLWLLDIGFVI